MADATPLLGAKKGGGNGTVRIQYVRLEHSSRHLHVQQVEVFDCDGKNWALASGGAKCTASSVVHDGKPELVIDGNHDDDAKWPSCNMTKNDKLEWLQVDLGSEVEVAKVVVWNRPDSLSYLDGCKIKFLDVSEEEVWVTEYLSNERQQGFSFAPDPKLWLKKGAWACTKAQATDDRGKVIFVNEPVKIMSCTDADCKVFVYINDRETTVDRNLLRRWEWADLKRALEFRYKSIWAFPIGLATFIGGYYSDVASEIYSIYNFFQSPTTAPLAYALIGIVFASPTACWLLLWSNNLESKMGVPLFLTHIMPMLEARRSMDRFRAWYGAMWEALKTVGTQPAALRKSPLLTWLPVCKSVFASSLTLLFKTYGVFLQLRSCIMTGVPPKNLAGVLISMLIGAAGMGHSIVTLSHYGMHMSMFKEGFLTGVRFIEVTSRVLSVGLFGIVFSEKHSIIAVLACDYVLQLLLLLLHPSSRKLMRNEMKVSMLLFWAAMMVLAAPPVFIPQLEDIHSAYYVLRLLELVGLLASMVSRCGWPGLQAGSGTDVVSAGCQLTDPFGTAVSVSARSLAIACYAAAAAVPLLLLFEIYTAMTKRMRLRRVANFRKQQAKETGHHLGPLRYGEELYMRVCSVPNRFLVAGEGKDDRFLKVASPHCTKDDFSAESFVQRAGWMFVQGTATGGIDAEKGVNEVKFGDIVRIKSSVGAERFMSGGRRGCNQFVVTQDFVLDLRTFPLSYAVEDHYKWLVVAIKPGFGPDASFRHGTCVDVIDHFALMAAPTLHPDRHLYLSAARGATTQTADQRKEVWTVPFTSCAAEEDSPIDGRWPSFEFLAQRKPMIDSSVIAGYMEAIHDDQLQRQGAMATAGQNEDIMMENFMMVSGVPPTATDKEYFTPLHHFILQYAREGDAKVKEATQPQREYSAGCNDCGESLSLDSNAWWHNDQCDDYCQSCFSKLPDEAKKACVQVKQGTDLKENERDYCVGMIANTSTPSGGIHVDHKVPISIFEQMLRSGLPHLELGAVMSYTPLHFAALLGERRLCDVLLGQGADINVGDADDWTCLHDAVMYDHRDMIKYLLSRPGIDVDAKARCGLRPIQVTGSKEVAEWLASKGSLQPTGMSVTAVPPPPPADGDKYITNFADPREDKELSKAKCCIDNQGLAGKFLAARNCPSTGGPVCFYCARGVWFNGPGSHDLLPAFRCPDCNGISRIPYFNSQWDICWCCQRCSQRAGTGKFPLQERLEAGTMAVQGTKAKALFQELDTDNGGSLSMEEFTIFVERLFGTYDPAHHPDAGQEGQEADVWKPTKRSEELFKEIDKDGNGSLSLAEFQAYFSDGGANGRAQGGAVDEKSDKKSTSDSKQGIAKKEKKKKATTFSSIPCLETLLLLNR